MGPYISAAVLSISCGVPLPVVDGNVLRVVSRFRGWSEDIRKNPARRRIRDHLQGIIPPREPGDFNQALMELGARVCLPRKPRCSSCPLNGRCVALREGRTGSLPRKSPREPVPHYSVVIAAIVDDEKRVFIQKRPSHGHLGGMWEFPGGKVKAGESARDALIRECREELHTRILPLQRIAVVKHAYTHFQITLTVYVCRIAPGAPAPAPRGPGRWVTFRELSRYPFPGANHKFFPLLGEYLSAVRD